MGGFRASTTIYNKVPDVAGLRRFNAQLLFVGELKTPWFLAHSLSNISEEQDLRDILGQIAQYMQGTNMAYGFMSNYEETIFLRQVPGPANTWRLEYSPVVDHSSITTNGGITLRQCFMHLAFQPQHQVANQMAQWVEEY